MKTKNGGLGILINELPPGKLAKPGKDTPAKRSFNSRGKLFSSGDLWNIQRRKKNTRLKRNYL